MSEAVAKTYWQHVADEGRAWWTELQPGIDETGARRKGNRAALARLRRTASLIDALGEKVTIDLARRLGQKLDGARRVAIIAATLAHVRQDARGLTTARLVGYPEDKDGKPLLSELRFRRLLAARDEDLLIDLRRLVALAGGRANVGDLAVSILGWSDKTRRRWAFDYFDPSWAASDRDSAQFPLPASDES